MAIAISTLFVATRASLRRPRPTCNLAFRLSSTSPSTPPFFSIVAPSVVLQTRRFSSSATMASTSPSSIYEITVKDARGNDVALSAYKDKVLLIVNVACECGLTKSNYTELSELYSKYKDQGFEILAFPCNQFGGQEPGSNEQIQQFASSKFKAEFPIFDKVDVNGPQTARIYQYLKNEKGGGIFGESIKWNFAKFLVDKDGKVVDRFAPTTPPSKIEKDVKKLLGIS